ncbi:MAG: hypothetical protein E7K65_15495, partial [Pseudomonas sp.]|nr:hypothetical protein [Pseudomonas sp.]
QAHKKSDARFQASDFAACGLKVNESVLTDWHYPSGPFFIGPQIAPRPVAVDEHREATFGCAAVVKPCSAVGQFNLALSLYDRFAIGRSLVKLGTYYRRLGCSTLR